ncbi:AMP-binding protein, partial [Maribacter sp. 2307UL18-2]|uniref:AMP-binding protein n=1 Tax=Maribacter sp. 2307UL18-2 TaxID=3386274 RepID=UPI0039BCADE2
YSTDLFKRETMERFVTYFKNIVGSVIEDPTVRLSDIAMITPDERDELLHAYNDTAVAYPLDRTVIDLFEDQVEKAPDSVAVFNGGESVTYSELFESALGVADFLSSRSSRGDVIGVFGDRSIDTIVAIVGILMNGSAYFPIDMDAPSERIRYMLDDAKVNVILTDSLLPEDISDTYSVFDISSIEIQQAHEETLSNGLLSDLAYVIYTSGTSGRPKGVMISHRNIVSLVVNADYVELDESTRILLTGAFSFDATTFEIWGSLLNGGSLYLPPQATLLDSNLLGAAIKKYDINTMWLTSSLYNFHVDEKAEIFKGLKYLLIGGEALSPYHVNKIMEMYPAIQMINGYGPTENTTFSICYRIGKDCRDRIPIGRPIGNTKAYILGVNNQLLPKGTTGELCIGGAGLARGY